MNKSTKIVCGFPGVGKSTLFNDPEFSSKYTVLDSDSSKFDKKFFPNNYIKHIKDNIGIVDYIFVSTHEDVIDALIREGLKFVIVYPSKDRKLEFVENYRNRGNDQKFIDKLCSNWETWIDNIIKRENCYCHCILRGEYLIDAIKNYIQHWKFIENHLVKTQTEESKIYTFAIDFDGTCVTDCFPAIGEEIGAAEVLLELQEKGHKIILNTVRSNQEGEILNDAIKWFEKHHIRLYGVNHNPDQESWSSSPKVHADYFIDDKAIGTPLITFAEDKPPHVDWTLIRKFLIEKGIL